MCLIFLSITKKKEKKRTVADIKKNNINMSNKMTTNTLLIED